MAFDAHISGKTATVGVAGAAATVLVFAAALFGLVIPAEVAVAAVSLILLAVNYFIPAKSGTNVDYQVDDSDYTVIEDDNSREVV